MRRVSPGPAGPTCEILSIGTLIPRKGHDVLLRALARLFDLDWHLTIAGSPDRDPAHAHGLMALAEELDIAHRVRFAGELVGDALEAQWRAADLFALATHYEGYGMAIAEALKRGLPVAVTAGGAAGAAGHAGSRLVCPVGDRDQLSKALRRLIFGRDLRREMAEAAWQVGTSPADLARRRRDAFAAAAGCMTRRHTGGCTMLLGAIADDFTGATDLCSMLVRGGMRTVQLIGVPRAGRSGARCRRRRRGAEVAHRAGAPGGGREPGRAELAARGRLRGSSSSSTARPSTAPTQGNIGPVADALIAGARLRLRARLPGVSRPMRARVYQGHLFVGGALLNESGMEHHPLTPMTDANLVRVLSRQTDGTVGPGAVRHRRAGRAARSATR